MFVVQFNGKYLLQAFVCKCAINLVVVVLFLAAHVLHRDADFTLFSVIFGPIRSLFSSISSFSF